MRPLITILPSALAPLCLAWIVAATLPEMLFVEEPLHALVEGVGSLIAILTATFIILMCKSNRLGSEFVWIALGLIWMGILDFVHAASHPGELFVWVHSAANFSGGLAFALILTRYDVTKTRWVIFGVYPSVLLACLFCFTFTLYPEYIPQMLHEDEFTDLASILNIAGGFGFIGACCHFILSKRFDLSKPENILVANHCMLFGIAGVLFEYSELWDSTWWLWHFLRLGAYSILFFYFLNLYRHNMNLAIEDRIRYQEIVEGTADLITVVDNDGKFLFVNDSAYKILGKSPEDCIGLIAFDFVHPDDQECTRRNFESWLTSKAKSVKYENRQLNEHGDTYNIRWTINFHWNHKNSELVSINSIGQDVTRESQIEQKLRQSQKLQSVGTLAAGMAHEINNPLAGIMQNADLLRLRLFDDKLKTNLRAAKDTGISMDQLFRYMEDREISQILGAITESGKRASSIVHNMLSFIRHTDSTHSTHFINDLLDKSIELAKTDYNLKKHYDFKSIRIHKEYYDQLPPVSCDSGEMQQVFLNILHNAAQAMQESNTVDPMLKVQTELDVDNDVVQIKIYDNGPGIDEVSRKRIFDPFYTTKKVGKGTGLGLSVAYYIVVDSHGGELDVESNSPNGVCFIIRMPVVNKSTSGSM